MIGQSHVSYVDPAILLRGGSTVISTCCALRVVAVGNALFQRAQPRRIRLWVRRAVQRSRSNGSKRSGLLGSFDRP